MAWTVDFYEEDGSVPLEGFLEGLPKKHRAKAIAIIRLLEEQGMNLRFPYSSQVRGKIRELRTQQAKDKIRILYFGDSRRWFILVHGIIKRVDKLSDKDIELAEQRMRKHEKKLKEVKKK